MSIVRSRSLLRRIASGPLDATGLSRWRFTTAATRFAKRLARCHGLAPWRFTSLLAWRHGDSPVNSVNPHGASPWHPWPSGRPFVAGTVNVQRDKLVASSELSHRLDSGGSRLSNFLFLVEAREPGAHPAAIINLYRHSTLAYSSDNFGKQVWCCSEAGINESSTESFLQPWSDYRPG